MGPTRLVPHPAEESTEIARYAKNRPLLYPHTYPHIDVSAIAEIHVDIGSAAPILTIAATPKAD